MASHVPIPKLIAQIQKHHQAALTSAAASVDHVIQCGRLLTALKSATGPGDWDHRLSEAGLSKTTAWRYMRVAHDASRKSAKHLLDQGASLVDLYREFGLVKPCEGGGYRSEVYQRRKALGDAQMELDFRYEEFAQHATALVKAPNVEKLSPTSLERLEETLTAALSRVREIKSRKTIDLQP